MLVSCIVVIYDAHSCHVRCITRDARYYTILLQITCNIVLFLAIIKDSCVVENCFFFFFASETKSINRFVILKFYAFLNSLRQTIFFLSVFHHYINSLLSWNSIKRFSIIILERFFQKVMKRFINLVMRGCRFRIA